MHMMMLVIMLITSTDHWNDQEPTLFYKSTSWTKMDQDKCWDMAADINSHARVQAGNVTAMCVPIIHSNTQS